MKNIYFQILFILTLKQHCFAQAQEFLPVSQHMQHKTIYLTRLRQQGDLQARWSKRGTKVRLEYVELKLKNVGDFMAEDVKVTLILPSGRKEKLRGEKLIARNKSETYSLKLSESATTMHKLKAQIECSNCR